MVPRTGLGRFGEEKYPTPAGTQNSDHATIRQVTVLPTLSRVPLSLHVKLVIRVFHKFRDVNVNNTISITSELWHHFWVFFINHAQHFLDAKKEFLELC